MYLSPSAEYFARSIANFFKIRDTLNSFRDSRVFFSEIPKLVLRRNTFSRYIELLFRDTYSFVAVKIERRVSNKTTRRKRSTRVASEVRASRVKYARRE